MKIRKADLDLSPDQHTGGYLGVCGMFIFGNYKKSCLKDIDSMRQLFYLQAEV